MPKLYKQRFGVVPGTTLYYSVDVFVTSQPSAPGASQSQSPASQVVGALTQWNSANQTNGTNVTFAPADANLTFVAGGDVGAATAQTEARAGAITSTSTIKTTFFSDNSAYYDPKQPGYNSMYFQAALHEIGHIMGIGDVPIPKKVDGTPDGNAAAALPADAMNPCVNVNDSAAKNQPTKPSDCNNTAAFNAAWGFFYLLYGPYTQPDPSPIWQSGVGGGFDWWDLPICDQDIWDDDSNTLHAGCSLAELSN